MSRKVAKVSGYDAQAVHGALRLARMVPLLEVIRTPFLAEVDEIISVCGEGRGMVRPERVEAIVRWREKFGPIQDAISPGYFQATAGGVALAVVGGEYILRRSMVIQHSPGNFWKACDNLVHCVDGYRMPEFRDIKTTLEGVENMWQQRDVEAVETSGDLRRAFTDQIAKIKAMNHRRCEVASAVARCAGW